MRTVIQSRAAKRSRLRSHKEPNSTDGHWTHKGNTGPHVATPNDDTVSKALALNYFYLMFLGIIGESEREQTSRIRSRRNGTQHLRSRCESYKFQEFRFRLKRRLRNLRGFHPFHRTRPRPRDQRRRNIMQTMNMNNALHLRSKVRR